ncbi:23S rRNA (uracil(1939)-C(5))-methyltransferase RlmD [Atopococcus tabaci]|uniref:23S rRNA (uracil(1939)-C(5))-methyltransferase RlmD n=1 Tax=Atopococcus tabaci TaxID=269774 RepID=UPI0003F8217E|nr:23S rRNA (uracil(1939)-C(5))-methyltransferase RlmD [Atopococcus tabaci]
MSAKQKRTYPVNKNEVYTAEVEDLTHEGLGVAKVNNYPLFIEGALPGETIEFKVIKTGKSFGFGRLLEVKETSPHRVKITDKAYTHTGTMPLQHMTYEAQLAFKQNQVKNVLQRIAKLPDVPVFDTIGMDHPYGYRNKAQVPVQEVDGKLTTGFFRKRSHDLVPLEDFLIQDPKIDEAIVVVRDILRRHHIPAYNEIEHTGLIRHIVVRRGYYTGELMIVLVTRKEGIPGKDAIVEEIKEALPETVSIVQNINSKRTNVILGRQSVVLYGEDKYRDQLLGFTFEISHQSFYQINPTQTEKLYQTALDYAELTGEETVIDAYCGIGTITLALAQKAKHVHGIEIVAPAIDNAKRNAELNQVNNVSFEVGAAEDIMVQWAKDGKTADVLVVDPPRKGLDSQFIDAVLMMQPKRMVYVSCNPSTLARDLALLSEGGYTVHKAQPVDMFPQTTHVESVVLMSRA